MYVQSLSKIVTVVVALMVPIGDKSLERGMRLWGMKVGNEKDKRLKKS